LKDMYKNLPSYKDNPKQRTKQLNSIASYVKSKLTNEEMRYFNDISSMLRTGDLR